jgi:hypothetical protein
LQSRPRERGRVTQNNQHKEEERGTMIEALRKNKKQRPSRGRTDVEVTFTEQKCYRRIYQINFYPM